MTVGLVSSVPVQFYSAFGSTTIAPHGESADSAIAVLGECFRVVYRASPSLLPGGSWGRGKGWPNLRPAPNFQARDLV